MWFPIAAKHQLRAAEIESAARRAVAPRPKLSDALVAPQQQDAFAETPPPGEIRLVWGRSGDHAAVYHMLLAVFQAPSRDEFQAQTEDPFYEPTDRLLVKRGFRVLSHLHLTRRTMYFGNISIPVAGFHGLGTLPEFRGQGFATRLLDEGLRRVAAEGRRWDWCARAFHDFSAAPVGRCAGGIAFRKPRRAKCLAGCTANTVRCWRGR